MWRHSIQVASKSCFTPQPFGYYVMPAFPLAHVLQRPASLSPLFSGTDFVMKIHCGQVTRQGTALRDYKRLESYHTSLANPPSCHDGYIFCAHRHVQMTLSTETSDSAMARLLAGAIRRRVQSAEKYSGDQIQSIWFSGRGRAFSLFRYSGRWYCIWGALCTSSVDADDAEMGGCGCSFLSYRRRGLGWLFCNVLRNLMVGEVEDGGGVELIVTKLDAWFCSSTSEKIVYGR